MNWYDMIQNDYNIILFFVAIDWFFLSSPTCAVTMGDSIAGVG